MNNSPQKDIKRLLIIDDEENICRMLATSLKNSGYMADIVSDGSEGLQKLCKTCYDFILCDITMPGMKGMDFLKSAKEKLGNTTIIMMSAYGSTELAIKAMELGAHDYISKPFKTEEVSLALKKAEQRKNQKEYSASEVQIKKNYYHFGEMIAKSSAMLKVFDLAEKASRYNTTVLIVGESGTGKELIAKGIHFCGKRADNPFIPVNCGAIPKDLVESEFFGYKKGAFTGAEKDKKGLFEEANGGTIFLDEIGELPLYLQVKLLRVLQESEIRPVGDSKTKKIDVRVIAATAKNLEAEVKKGFFRQDLFYRLNVLPIKLSPLRERTEDIPLLSEFFISRFKKILNKDITGISPDVMSAFLTYKWQGNVRELENVIERAVVLAEKTILSMKEFPEFEGSEKYGDDDRFEGYSLKNAQKVLEKRLITKALVATRGNRTEAIQLLEISYPSLLSKIKDYNISV